VCEDRKTEIMEDRSDVAENSEKLKNRTAMNEDKGRLSERRRTKEKKLRVHLSAMQWQRECPV
jgi:hypothetical protein